MTTHKLTGIMRAALELYGRIATGDIGPEVTHAYPSTGTTAALVGRELLTPAARKWEHEPTDAGWDWLAEHTSYTPIVARLHVGYNDAGYSPNNAPYCTASAHDAAEVLLADMFRTLEHLGDACDHMPLRDDCEHCRTYLAAEEAQKRASNELNRMTRVPLTGYAVSMPDGRPLPVIHWIEHVTMDHRECNKD